LGEGKIALEEMLEAEVLQKNIEDYDSVRRWITRLNKKSRSPNTRRSYLGWLKRFCEYRGLNPDELIEERRADLRSRDDDVRHRAEDKLDAWFSELEIVHGLKRSTCAQAYYAIRSFYKANRQELETIEPPTVWTEKVKPGLTREDLGRLIRACRSLRHKAYILCQAQSGLGVSDLLNVTYGDVASQIKKGADHIHLRLLRMKEKQIGQFDTFFGRIATQALKEYLATRKLKPTDRLFPITDRAVRKFLKTLSIRAGLDWTPSSHDLRRFFSTQMKLAGLNETLVEYWMGHSLGKVRGAYFVPPVEEQLRLYKQAEKWLEP